MFVFFMILSLILLISGGIGLFYTNINFAAGSHYWMYGNLTFGTFAIIGIATLIFMALFNAEFE
jgi:hypothetical protein